MSRLFDGLWNQVVNLVATIMPASEGLPLEMVDSVSTISGYLFAFNDLFPLDDLFTLMVFYVGFELGVLTFHLVRWVLNLLRGSGA